MHRIITRTAPPRDSACPPSWPDYRRAAGPDRPASAQSQKKARRGASVAASLPALGTKVAFENLKFDRPVAFADPDDGSNLFFVVEQHTATIWSFPNERMTRDKQLFPRLPDPINRGNEEGLLGLAFHPKYKENKAVLRLLFGERRRQETFRRLSLPVFERQAAGRRPGERGTDLGFGRRPI